MDNYNSLISKILGNELLAKHVEESEKYLNLVTTDWMSRLENNAMYQDFSSHSKSLWKQLYSTNNYEYETLKNSSFSILLVGYCKFAKPFEGKVNKPGLIILDSEPLTKIARAMTSDLSPPIQISNDFKFNFVDCGILKCDECREKAYDFGAAGYKVNRLNQPCILDTQVFDGKHVLNRFLSQMESMFNQQFPAILHLKIEHRYNYISNKQKTYRITGDVLNIIAFNETKLTTNKKVDIGPLVNFEFTPEVEKTLSKDKPKNKDDDILDDIENFIGEDVEEIEKRKEYDEIEKQPIKKRKMIEEEECDDVQEDIFNLDG